MAKQVKPNSSKAIDKESKKILEQQERQGLVFGADALLPKKSIDKEIEKHQLRSGREFSIKEVKDLITELAQPYSPMFPNQKPFFKLMYKLCGWDHLNPNDFIKPPCVALWIKQFIYARFSTEILPKLQEKENPFISGYVRKYKLFQFLSDDGQRQLEGFIEDAIKVMEICKSWYEFEIKYGKLYKLSIQQKMYES